jgi:DNA-binding transcriptional regulator LsrR (DeoR family)
MLKKDCSNLPLDIHNVIRIRYVEGMTQKQVGVEMVLSVNSV